MTVEEGRQFIEPDGHTIDLVALREWQANQVSLRRSSLLRAANSTAERDARDERTAWGLPPADSVQTSEPQEV